MAFRDRSACSSQHCDRLAFARSGLVALASRRPLGDGEVEDHAARIDAQVLGRELLAQLEGLPELERVALELVDLTRPDHAGGGERVGDRAGALRCACSGHAADSERERRSGEPLEDHLWSQLVSDHGEQIRQAEKETAALAASLRESSGRRRWRASGRQPSRRQLVLAGTALGVACLASAIIVAHTAPKIRAARPSIPRRSPSPTTMTGP